MIGVFFHFQTLDIQWYLAKCLGVFNVYDLNSCCMNGQYIFSLGTVKNYILPFMNSESNLYLKAASGIEKSTYVVINFCKTWSWSITIEPQLSQTSNQTNKPLWNQKRNVEKDKFHEEAPLVLFFWSKLFKVLDLQKNGKVRTVILIYSSSYYFHLTLIRHICYN